MQDRRRLVPLNETAEYRVSPQAPDVRGWPAVLADGTGVGTVTDLIVDRAVGRVRYVEVALTDTPAVRSEATTRARRRVVPSTCTSTMLSRGTSDADVTTSPVPRAVSARKGCAGLPRSITRAPSRPPSGWRRCRASRW